MRRFDRSLGRIVFIGYAASNADLDCHAAAVASTRVMQTQFAHVGGDSCRQGTNFIDSLTVGQRDDGVPIRARTSPDRRSARLTCAATILRHESAALLPKV